MREENEIEKNENESEDGVVGHSKVCSENPSFKGSASRNLINSKLLGFLNAHAIL